MGSDDGVFENVCMAFMNFWTSLNYRVQCTFSYHGMTNKRSVLNLQSVWSLQLISSQISSPARVKSLPPLLTQGPLGGPLMVEGWKKKHARFVYISAKWCDLQSFIVINLQRKMLLIYCLFNGHSIIILFQMEDNFKRQDRLKTDLSENEILIYCSL